MRLPRIIAKPFRKWFTPISRSLNAASRYTQDVSFMTNFRWLLHEWHKPQAIQVVCFCFPLFLWRFSGFLVKWEHLSIKDDKVTSLINALSNINVMCCCFSKCANPFPVKTFRRFFWIRSNLQPINRRNKTSKQFFANGKIFYHFFTSKKKFRLNCNKSRNFKRLVV